MLRGIFTALALVATLSCSPTPPPGPTPGSAAPDPDGEPPPEPAPVGPKQLAQYGPEHIGITMPDVCKTNPDGTLIDPIAPGTYQGLLRNIRCEQEKFITMGRIAATLGVKCNHCHAPHPTDPKKEDYPKFTENKRRANWMLKTFIQGLRPVNGEKMMCASCHVDAKGQPTAKILEAPRDRAYAQEWMHEVMTTQFVEANGKRLRCKTCHGAMAPDLEGWVKDVIRHLRYEGTVQRRDDLSGDTGE